MLSKLFAVIKTIFEIGLLLLIVFSALVVLLSGKGFYGYRAFVLETGSMSPTMSAGSLIFTKTSTDYHKNDVITFYTNDETGTRQKLPTTHRVSEVKPGINLGYQTKGDGNNTVDPFITPAASVIGKVIFHLPYFGNFSEFAKTKNGFTYLIVIPLTILIYQQLVNVKEEVIKLINNFKNKFPPIPLEDSTPIRLHQIYTNPQRSKSKK